MALVDDIRELTDEVKALNRTGETCKQQLQKHENQINGKQGVFVELEKVSAKMDRLTRAGYGVIAAITLGSITFAFSVLQLIH